MVISTIEAYKIINYSYKNISQVKSHIILKLNIKGVLHHIIM